MAKTRKLQNEIERNLKQTDEGISLLNSIQDKLDHATSLQMKEKHEQDMKKEIKKLQRLREFFRQQLGKNEIKDTSKLELACTRIVNEMEKYREREKEFKQNRMSKSAIQKQNEREGKFNFGSDDESYGDNSDDSGQEGDELGSDMEEEGSMPDEASLQRDKDWFAQVFVGEMLRGVISHHEMELEAIRNKKKGGSKKNKEKVNTILRSLNHVKQIRDSAEELQIWLDYLEVGKMLELRKQAKEFIAQPEDEPQRAIVLKELEVLLEHTEANRTQEANKKEAELKLSQQLSSQKNEPVERRILIEQLKLKKNTDVIQDKFVRVEQLKNGNILDAQDYLDKWHLAIVVEEKEPTGSCMLHFISFNKGNRDEEFGEDDSNRIAPAFSRTEPSLDPDSQFQVLRNYYANYKRHGKKQQQHSQEETKSAYFSSNQHTPSSPNFKDQVVKQQFPDKNMSSSASSFNHLQSNIHGSLQQQQRAAQQQEPQRNFSSKSKSPSLSDEDPIRFPQQLKKGGAFAKHQEQLQQYQGSKQQPSFMPATQQTANAAHQHQLPPFLAQMNESDAISLPTDQAQQLEHEKPIGTGLFGSNPFASFKELPQPNAMKLNQVNPFGNGEFKMPPKEDTGLTSLGMPDSEPEVLTKFRSIQGLLGASFKNMPVPQDQEVVDPKHPVSVWHHQQPGQQLNDQIDSEAHDFPTVPLYNRKDNFSRFDLETLFFAFYYQQGTYQQHMAAVELKKKNWKFNKKFVTWFKKAETGNSLNTGSDDSPSTILPGRNSALLGQTASAELASGKDLGKYVFFDWENGWHQRVSQDIEMDISQIENELNVQPMQHGGAQNSAPARNNQ